MIDTTNEQLIKYITGKTNTTDFLKSINRIIFGYGPYKIAITHVGKSIVNVTEKCYDFTHLHSLTITKCFEFMNNKLNVFKNLFNNTSSDLKHTFQYIRQIENINGEKECIQDNISTLLDIEFDDVVVEGNTINVIYPHNSFNISRVTVDENTTDISIKLKYPIQTIKPEDIKILKDIGIIHSNKDDINISLISIELMISNLSKLNVFKFEDMGVVDRSKIREFILLDRSIGDKYYFPVSSFENIKRKMFLNIENGNRLISINITSEVGGKEIKELSINNTGVNSNLPAFLDKLNELVNIYK